MIISFMLSCYIMFCFSLTLCMCIVPRIAKQFLSFYSLFIRIMIGFMKLDRVSFFSFEFPVKNFIIVFYFLYTYKYMYVLQISIQLGQLNRQHVNGDS